MAIVLPVILNGNQLVGSATCLEQLGPHLLFATCLHLFERGTDIGIGVPPHMGDMQKPQEYPFMNMPVLKASVVAVDPFADLAIVAASDPAAVLPQLPLIASHSDQVSVGSEVVVLGYPYAPLGSVLETWVPTHVSARGSRRIAPNVHIEELILSNVSHPGSSGSAVVGKHDAVLYGIVRGSLAPASGLRIGSIPIASDSSVTFATSAHLLHGLLQVARNSREFY